ncbi:type 1 glutamine amidotransferase [Verrucomicrobiota bacterium]
MRLHWLQHESFEGLGYIEPFIRQKGFLCSRTRLFENEELPAVDQFDSLIIMGGSASIYEEAKYPWLAKEKIFIKQSIDAGKIVIGVCLGAQLIAEVLGGKVYKGQYREVGWHSVSLTEEGKNFSLLRNVPESFSAFHWHGDYIQTPPSCKRLMETKACSCQAFSLEERVLGLQFHLELSELNIEELMENCPADLAPDKYVQDPDLIREQFAGTESSRRIIETISGNIFRCG